MSSNELPRAPLDVLFVWHFHQPYYGVPGSEEFFLPWVRLHAAKAYYDMGRLLKDHPEVRATFNFSGSLLRQIDEYVQQGKRDRWWRWTKSDPGDLDLADRRGILRNFFSLDIEQCIKPSPRYQELYNARMNQGVAGCAESWTTRDFIDLQVLFNLMWCGFSVRDEFPLLKKLHDKGAGFSKEERDALLDVQLEVMEKLLPLYRELAERDQIELTVTPMYHPIVPLLIDTDVAARPSPDRPRPTRYRARGDAQAHIEEALNVAERAFGKRPRGMWPSEGSVSPEALQCFADAGASWIATDEEILRHSRGENWERNCDLYRPWRLGRDSPRIFFRDRGLSDQIGFVYSDNPADEAADSMIADLHTIHSSLDNKPGCVAIILDGENPWEHYDDDGRPFLEALYTGLEKSGRLRTNLPSQIDEPPPGQLDQLHSGSWIMGNYQIWIGHDETNQAWEWLRRADEHIKRVGESSARADVDMAQEYLRIAQGSDWFWWYGDDFSSEQDDQFDALFRALVAGVFTSLDEPAPPELNLPIGGNACADKVGDTEIIAPRRFISPEIDGRIGQFFDWRGAGQIITTGSHGSMYETTRPLAAILYGFSPLHFFLHLEPGEDFSSKCRFRVHIAHGDDTTDIDLQRGDKKSDFGEIPGTKAAFVDVAELSFPLHRLGMSPGDNLKLAVSVHRDGLQIQRFPRHDGFIIEVPTLDPGIEHWIV